MSVTEKSIAPSTKEKPLYAPLSYADDSDSDTLASSIDSLEQALPKPGARRNRRARSRPRSIRRSSRPREAVSRDTCLTWLRWLCIVSLQSIIIISLALQSKHNDKTTSEVETGGDINGLFPPGKFAWSTQRDVEYVNIPVASVARPSKTSLLTYCFSSTAQIRSFKVRARILHAKHEHQQ